MENQIYEFGGFRISALTRTLWRDSVEIPLTGREFDTLWALVQHPGVPLSWRVLGAEVWKDANVTENNLRQQISSLRRKLGHDSNGKDYILTIANQGYQLASNVVLVAEVRPDASRTSEPGPPRSAPVGPPLLPARHRRTLPLLVRAAAATLVVGGIVAAWELLPKEIQVLNCRQLTRDGRLKSTAVFVDGDRVYFNEYAGRKSLISTVSVNGGSVSRLPMMPAQVMAIASTRHSLLVKDEANELYEVQLGSFARRHILLPSGVSGGTATWDPQGRQIAMLSLDSLTVFEPGKSAPSFHANFTGPTNVSGWDPLGRNLRFEVWETKAEVTHWWDLAANSSVPQRLPHFSSNPREIHGTWTSDGRFFAFEGGTLGQSQIWVVDLHRRPYRSYQLTNDARSWHNPTFVPGSNTIVATAGQTQGQLVTLPVPGQVEEPKTLLAGTSAYELDYSRDRQWIAYTRFPEHTIWRCRLDGSDPRQVSPPGLEAHQPHWSPDGTRISMMGKMAGKAAHWRIYLAASSGGGLDEPLPEGDDQGVPTWAPDGRSLVFGDRTSFKGFEGAAIHELNLQTREVTTVPAPIGMWSPRMSPDGKHLAAISYDSKSLYIRDNTRKAWQKCVTMDFLEEPSWPLDSAWVQFSANPRPGDRALFRVSPQCEPPKLIVDTYAYRLLGDAWFGIGLDHSPSAFLQMPDEVYALDWRLRRSIP